MNKKSQGKIYGDNKIATLRYCSSYINVLLVCCKSHKVLLGINKYMVKIQSYFDCNRKKSIFWSRAKKYCIFANESYVSLNI